MMTLDTILFDLKDTDATLDELAAIAADAPKDRIVDINIEAVTRRRRVLEARLHRSLQTSQTDLIEYRLTPRNGSKSPAVAVFRSVAAFQALLTEVFSAVGVGSPGNSGADDPASLAMLGFASGERGSASVTLGFFNERLLLVPSPIEAAVELVLGLIETDTASRLRQIAVDIGVGPIVALRHWAEISVEQGVAVALRWRKAGEVDRLVEVPVNRAWVLRNIIDEIEDEASETVECECELLGLDHFTGDFRIVRRDGAQIAGRLGREFAPEGTLSLGGRYRATLSRTANVRYATGAEIVTFELLALAPQAGA